MAEKEKMAKPVAAKKPLAYSPERKLETIKRSKMPEAQKEAYMARVRGDAPPKGEMRLGAYLNSKGIAGKAMKAAMGAYPAAKAVEKATSEKWDEIFKNF
jgi:hypothetical protein